MEYFPAPLEKLVEQFARLPGIGSKSAQRLAFHVLNLPMEQAQEFANAIVEAKQKVTLCPICRNLTAGVPAPSVPTPSGTKVCCAWWRIHGMSSPWSGPESSMAATTSSMAFCPP